MLVRKGSYVKLRGLGLAGKVPFLVLRVAGSGFSVCVFRLLGLGFAV